MLRTILSGMCALALLASPSFSQEKPAETKDKQEAQAQEERAKAEAALAEARKKAQEAEEAARKAQAEAQKARVEAAKAEQEVIRAQLERRVKLRTEAASLGKYWIGVSCSPLSPVLQAQLGLPENQGMVVDDVVDESPAAKAGLAQNDVLLKVGDQALSNLEDLITAVQKAEGKELSLTYLRGGKEQTAKVTPAERPKEHFAHPPVGGFQIELPEGAEGGVRVWRPGVVFQKDLPKELSISISRKDKEKTRISVTVDGKSYDVTEEELDKLPENIREQVRDLVAGGPTGQYRSVMRGMTGMPGMQFPAGIGTARARAVASPETIEAQLQELNQKIEALQKAIDALTGKPSGAKPADSKEKAPFGPSDTVAE